MSNRSHRDSFIATALALAWMATLSAQEITTPDTPAPPASTVSEIVVTASRINKQGFDAPTPTTVLDESDIRAATRPSIAEVLADQPQFRAAGTPTMTNGSTNSSASVVDLRGLGSERTLTLLDGHRFIGSNDLNTIPQSIIKRVDVVTGGASAAWGSGAVAGVVNMIIDDDLDGLTLEPKAGISSRGDGARYGADLTYGTKFADGRGHILFAAEYFRDKGLFGRGDGSRPNLNASEFGTSSGQLLLVDNVNSIVSSPGGVITSGALAGMEFNPDGSLSPIPLGSQTNSTSTIGGKGVSGNEFQLISSPYHRANAYTRATYDVSDALTLSADFHYTRMWDDFPSFPEEVDGSQTSGITFQKDNPYLTPAAQALLASGPQTFNVGRIFGVFGDPEGFETLKYERRTLEGSVGASGRIGGSWSYDAYFDYGAIRQSQGFYNQRIEANFEQAIDAVRDPLTGNIVCRAALTDPNTPCRPLDLFGAGNASPAAVAYAYANGNQVNLTTTTSLTATGGSIHGDPFSTWAGAVSSAVGVDFRKEEVAVDYIDPLSAANALGSFNNSGTSGAFHVTEGFLESALPILDNPHVAKVDLNGAARYSNYSTSGGIWSWKYGATTRLIDDVLLRTVYSRDIRSPDINELYTAHSQANLTIVDPAHNNQSVTVADFSGGNTALKPEISHTLTLGGTYSPHFIPGLSLSLDYYRIDILDAIATLSAQDIVNQCAQGNAVTCAQITRDGSGQITTINNTYINLASYKTRGVDNDISYVMPLSRLFPNAPGTLRLRSFTNYVSSLIIDDGVNTYNRAGDVGDLISFNVPKWRSVESISYDNHRFGVNTRIRYVGGGLYDSLSPIVDNTVSSRTYLDLGAHVNIGAVTVTADIQNLFDRSPPYVVYATPFYDVWGRYYTLSFKVQL